MWDVLYPAGYEFLNIFQVNYCFKSRVEAGSNTLRVVAGDENGTQCLGVYLGHPVPGEYKYGDLALQVW
jgi:hypothetical protein